jgi:hypothetical protein
MTFKAKAIAYREKELSQREFHTAQARAWSRCDEWDTTRDPFAELEEDERQWRREIEALRRLPDDADRVTVRRTIQATSPKSYSEAWVYDF